MRKLFLLVLFACVALTAQAQYIQGSLNGGPPAPGPKYRSNLNTLERTVNLAGATILTDTFGNQRFALYVHIEDTCINYTPLPTGNTNNLSAFVERCGTDSLWYIDWTGASVFIGDRSGGAAASCDQDWLTISTDTCPTSIYDSIYHQKYASVGARYVWPGATFLVNDSTSSNGVLMVIQGERSAKLAFYDLLNERWTMLYSNNTDLSVYVPQDGTFNVSTVSGTPDAPVADVPHFQVFTLDSTIAMNQYPNTRRDTQAVANFLYTDDMGIVRSQSVDSFPLAGRGGIYGGSGLIPDSTSAEVSFGGFFQIAYPSGVFDPAIRVTDNPPTTSRQVDINSTNATIQVYPNNVTIEAQDGVNMVSNDGTELEGTFFLSPYSVGISLDSTAPATGWSRLYATGGFAEMQAADGGTGGVATLRTYNTSGAGVPNVLASVDYTGATYPINRVLIDTNGVKIQTRGSAGTTGQVLRNVNGYAVWQDSSASASVNIYNSNGTISTNRTVTLGDTLLFDAASSAGSLQYNSLTGNNLEMDDTQFQVGDITNASDGIGLKVDAANVTMGDVFDLGNTYVASGTGGNYVRTDASNLQQTLSNTLWTINDGYFFFQDLRTTKPGVEYSLATLGADFTDSTLVHRRYVADMISDSLATIPGGGDVLQGGNSFGASMVIGTNDNNLLLLRTNGVSRASLSSGASTGGAWSLINTSANTNTPENMFNITSNSSGTAATGFGLRHTYELETSTTNAQDAGAMDIVWSDATNATRTGDFVFSTVASGAALAELFRMGGTSYALTATASVSNTNTVADRFTIRTNSSGTAAASFGGGILFQGESTTTDNQDMARISSYWTTATHASREAAFSIELGDSGGALAECFKFDRVSASGRLSIGNTSPLIINNTSITTASNPLAISSTSSSLDLFSTTSSGVNLYNSHNTATSTASIIIGNALSFTQTSGTRNYLNVNYSFAPTSGTAVNNALVFSGTLNQTGGANGIIRDIYLNRTVTAVSDYRGIEIAYSNSSAKGVYQSGANTTNNFVGGTMFGSTSAPSAVAAIEVSSTTKGILFPRMTTTQRDAITAVAGLAIFNTTTSKLEVYDGAAWQQCW